MTKRNTVRRSRHVAPIAVAGGSGLALLALEALVWLDWDHGVARALLVTALVAAAAFAIVIAAKRAGNQTPQPRVLRVLLVAATMCLGVGLAWQGISRLQEVRRGHALTFDQAKLNVRAVRMLSKGMNPYARGVVVDTTEYLLASQALRRDPCLVSAPSSHLGYTIAEGFGQDFNLRRFDRLIPKVSDSPECRLARLRADSFGHKYGPSLLGAYAPFVWLLGESGILAAHLVFLAAAVVALARLAWRLGGESVVWAPIALLFFLLPSHLRHNAFVNPSTDLVVTALVLIAWALVEEERQALGAAFLALALAAKLAPAMFYLPLLLRCRWPARVAFLATLALFLGPFLVWDARGLITNLLLLSFIRDADSTALVFSLPPLLAALVQILCALSVVAAFIHVHRRHHERRSFLIFLLVAHGAALVSAKTFHNNYLVWLLPLLGLALVASLRPRSPDSESKNASELSPSAA